MAVEDEINQVIKKDKRLLQLEQIITSVDGVAPLQLGESLLQPINFNPSQTAENLHAMRE